MALFAILETLLGILFIAAPFALGGWMFGYTARHTRALAIFAAAAVFWTGVFVVTAHHTDPSLSTVWLVMSLMFLVPALAGALISELRKNRQDRSGEDA
jgi:hypothetical protein